MPAKVPQAKGEDGEEAMAKRDGTDVALPQTLVRIPADRDIASREP